VLFLTALPAALAWDFVRASSTAVYRWNSVGASSDNDRRVVTTRAFAPSVAAQSTKRRMAETISLRWCAEIGRPRRFTWGPMVWA